MKILPLLLFTCLLFAVGCKKNESVKLNTENKIENSGKTTDTLVVDVDNSIVFFEPNEAEIEELKIRHGEDDFYIIADDVAGYIANITEELDAEKIKYVSTESRVIHFKESNVFVDKAQLSSKWFVVYFDKEHKLKTVAPIDFKLAAIDSRYLTNSASKAKEEETDKCFKKLEKLLGTSDFGVALKKKLETDEFDDYDDFVIYIESATKERISVEVLSKTNKGRGLTLAWLKIDLNNNEVTDITNDPENPIAVKCNKVLLDEFKKDCLQYCLD